MGNVTHVATTNTCITLNNKFDAFTIPKETIWNLQKDNHNLLVRHIIPQRHVREE
jgi:hypothetical protein